MEESVTTGIALSAFTFTRTPEIVFGEGVLRRLPDMAAGFGGNVLLVTGGKSLRSSGRLDELEKQLSGKGLKLLRVQVSGEPSPEMVDTIAAQHRDTDIHVVLAVGGGSVIDAAKAVSAMLPVNLSVMEFLEGVGTRQHPGTKVPMIAVPTTAGTGSEATKNAVLSRTGPNGFKRSLRHDNFVPNIALVDPSLMLSCPPDITAACGMDALTQLVESYVSSKATPFTDSLALPAIGLVLAHLESACGNGAGDVAVRSAIAYGALVSGITLANAGLGIIHGLASPLGAHFPVPHGVACGTLLAAAMKTTVEKLRSQGRNDFLEKFARMGSLIRNGALANDTDVAVDDFIKEVYRLTDKLAIARLGEYGISRSDLDMLAAEAGNKNNPARLDRKEIMTILEERL